jgi:hypothetical protein
MRLLKYIIFASSMFVYSYGGCIDLLSISYDEAIKRAKKENKIIFFQLYSSDCAECNNVAKRRLESEELDELFEQVIAVRIDPTSKNAKLITNKYRIKPEAPSSLIVDKEGNFISAMLYRTTSNSDEYFKMTALAINRKNNPPLKQMETKYSKGDYTINFLEIFIEKLSKYRFETEQLLDEYAEKLTIAQAMSPEKLLFLIKHSSIIESRVDKVIQLTPADIFDSIFLSLDYEERVKINRRKIHESKQLAIRNQDQPYMRKVAGFTRSAYSDTKDPHKYYNREMLDFYKEVNDSLQYVKLAIRHYRQYYKDLNLDSISQVELSKTVDRNGKKVKSPRFYTVGNKINEMAWKVYELTKDTPHLQSALKWSKATLAYKYAPYTDTYAHILYELGNHQEAIQWQQMAISQTRMLSPEKRQKLEEALRKMKNGDLD